MDAFVRLYGGPLLHVGERTIRFSPVQAALIALTYVEAPGTVTREQATWLLWSAGEDDRSRHRIRQLLYAINNRAGVPVLDRRGELLTPLLPSDASEISPSPEPPLPLLTSPPTAAYEHWLDGALARLRAGRRERAAVDLDAAVQAGEWALALDRAEELIRLHPGEREWVEIMVDVSLRGGAAARCSAMLRELKDRGSISEGDRADLARRLSVLPPAWKKRAAPLSPLVGRSLESAWLARQIDQAAGLRTLALLGEGGIGKTRLLESAASHAATVGIPVGWIQLTQGSRARPLEAMRRVISELVPPETLAGLPAPWGAILADFVNPGSRGVELLDPTATGQRLREAILIGLTQVTSESPVLVVIDDLHWIDDSSAEVLAHLAARWCGGPCAIAVAARPERRGRPAPALESLLQGMRADRQWLQGLDTDACRELLARAGIERLSAGAVHEVIEVTKGNPLLLLDLARDWEDHPDFRIDRVPQTLRDLTQRRMRDLGPIERELLSVLVALPDSDSRQLSSALARPAWQVVEALDSLVSAGIVEMRGTQYGFRHRLLLEAIGQELGETRRREGHLIAARHLASTSQPQPGEVVHHFQEAGALREAAEWAVAASEDAQATGALNEALDFLELALESPQCGADAGLLSRAGALALLLCQREKGIRFLDRAIGIDSGLRQSSIAVDRLDAMSEAGVLPHTEVAERLRGIRTAAVAGANWELEVSATEAAIRVLERSGDWRSVAELLQATHLLDGKGSRLACIRRNMVLALAMVYGSPERAKRAARQAFEMATEDGDEGPLAARAAHRLFVVLLSEGGVETSLGARCRSLLRSRANATGDLKLRYSSLANEAVWDLDTENLDAAEAKLDEAEQVIVGTGATNELQNLATNRGDLLLRQGDPAAAVQQFELAQSLINTGTRGFLGDLVLAGIGLGKLRMGQLNAAERALGAIGTYDHYFFDPSLMVRLRTEIAWRRNDYSTALAVLSGERSRIRDQFVPQYLTLTLLEADLRRRLRDNEGRSLAESVAETAGSLGISRVAERARRAALRFEP